MKALCFGSLNIDRTYRVPHFVTAGETLAAESLCFYAGGKGLNQSVALARGGAAVCHAGCVGRDGAFLLETLRGAGVNTDFVRVCEDEETGHTVIQTTPDGENCILLYGGANRAVTRGQIDGTLAAFERDDFLVLQNEITELPYLLEQGRAKGLRVAFTPAPMDEAVPRYPLQAVDYLLLNRHEGAVLCGEGDGTSAEALARKLTNLTGGAVILTLGADGALYAEGDELLRQPAFPVTAVDTTGAGDTFAGFFLAAVMRGETAETALRLAAKAAALSVTKPGAAVSIPTLADVMKGENP